MDLKDQRAYEHDNYGNHEADPGNCRDEAVTAKGTIPRVQTDTLLAGRASLHSGESIPRNSPLSRIVAGEFITA